MYVTHEHTISSVIRNLRKYDNFSSRIACMMRGRYSSSCQVIWRFPWELFWKTLGWSGAATAGVGTGGLQAGGIHGGGAAGGMEGAPQQDAGGDIAWNLAGGAIDPRVGAAVDIVAAEMGMENAHVQVGALLQGPRTYKQQACICAFLTHCCKYDSDTHGM